MSKRWGWWLCYFFLTLCQEPSGLFMRQGWQLFICWERCCKMRFAGFLVPKLALVWGMVARGLRIEIFVRVLRSSRVKLNNMNDTNVFCCVWIESPFIYFLLQFSILCYKSSVGNKVQFYSCVVGCD